MSKGRKVVPSKTKQLRATNQPCRIKNEPTGQFVSKIPAPKREWSTNTKRIYKTTMDYLMMNNLLNEVNLPLAASYAIHLGRFFDLERKFQDDLIDETETKTGKSRSVKPEYRIMKESYEMALRAAAEFGITPSAAAKIAKPEVKEKDPFSDL